jgi:acyl carrier protein
MANLDKYNDVFLSVFNCEKSVLNENFSVSSVDNWDSITQLTLVTEIEDAFEIMLDTEDILDFKSYSKGKEIVAKYGVEII